MAGKVVIAIMGAFSPPTLAHKDGAKKYARKLMELYPSYVIEIAFMPTNHFARKTSVNLETAEQNTSSYFSQEERQDMICTICKELTTENEFGELVIFHCSTIEFDLGQKYLEQTGMGRSPSTIETIIQLTNSYPGSSIAIGMGADNVANFHCWVGAQYDPSKPDQPLWSEYVSDVLVIDRALTQDGSESVAFLPAGSLIPSVSINNTVQLAQTCYDTVYDPERHPGGIRLRLIDPEGWGPERFLLAGTSEEDPRRTLSFYKPDHTETVFGRARMMRFHLLPAPEPYGISSTEARRMLAVYGEHEKRGDVHPDLVEEFCPRTAQLQEEKDALRKELHRYLGASALRTAVEILRRRGDSPR